MENIINLLKANKIFYGVEIANHMAGNIESKKTMYIVDRWGYSIDVLSRELTNEDGHTIFVGESGREYPACNHYYLHDLNGQCEEQWNCQIAQGNGIGHCQCGLCPPEED